MKKKSKILTILILLILIIVGGCVMAGNKDEGKFVRVGDMHYARSEHKAVLLQDGRVLIIGGAIKKTALKGGRFLEGTDNTTTEIYDPKTKKFTLTGRLNINRGNYTTTLLKNGKVLIAGAEGNKIKSTELFNPDTGIFEKGPDMNYPRSYHTANLLPDGRVLIAGGQGGFLHSELYNPETNTFELAPKMNIPRFMHASISISNGDVLIVGGIKPMQPTLTNIEKYDYEKNKFINIGEIKIGRKNPSVILNNNDSVFIYGGNNEEIADSFGVIKEGEIFNLLTKNSIVVGKSSLVGDYPTLIKLQNGKILVTGGSVFKAFYGYEGIKKTETFDPVSNEFNESIDMIKPHSGHSATLLNDGTVLIAGSGETGKTFKYAELYIPNNK